MGCPDASESSEDIRLKEEYGQPIFEKRLQMKNESKIMKEILREIRETNRSIDRMSRAFLQLMQRLVPEDQSKETIQKGGPIAEITVRTPEKLEEWRSLFENRGMRVEYYEPMQADDEKYFAKLWGYLENNKGMKTHDGNVPELKRSAFLTREKTS